MTITVRRTILSAMLAIALLMLLVVALGWLAYSRGLLTLPEGRSSVSAVYWGFWRPAGPDDPFWILLTATVSTVFPLAFELLFGRRFRRSPSPEIFFVRLYLLSLSLQALRLAQIPIFLGELPMAWAIPLCRAVFWGRFLGSAVLVDVGLFSGDLPFRRSGVVLGVGALAAFALSVLMPLDITQPMGNLIYMPGAWKAFSLAVIAMEGLAVLSLLGAAAREDNRRYMAMAAVFPMIVVGGDLMFFGVPPLTIPGMALLMIGTGAFAREVREIYLWI